jgi:hypothetical protein
MTSSFVSVPRGDGQADARLVSPLQASRPPERRAFFASFKGPKCLKNASKKARPDSYQSDTYHYLSDTI